MPEARAGTLLRGHRSKSDVGWEVTRRALTNEEATQGQRYVAGHLLVLASLPVRVSILEGDFHLLKQ